MAVNPRKNVVRPQEGYQMRFLSSAADIAIGGGSAGGGKTFSLLMEYLRHMHVPKWGGVIFRRTSPQIRSEGGLWDTSKEIYSFVGAEAKESRLTWVFPSGSKLKFSHLEHEHNIFDWQGSQVPFIGFDELTHFSEQQFFYLLTRNRSVSGVRPYVRATCNPDPDGWVHNLIRWWIDEDTGYPIPERNGFLRYFIKYGDSMIWGDNKADVVDKTRDLLADILTQAAIKPEDLVKSITFISGSVYENKMLLDANPEYLANLLSQDEQTVSQLLHGCWKRIITADDVFNYYKLVAAFDSGAVKPGAKRYITADIALEGSDKFVVGVWYDRVLEDVVILDKSNGRTVLETIRKLAETHRVPENHIAFDNDGVGGFLGGFLTRAVPFAGGGQALKDPDTRNTKPENYKNLKTQCYYRSGAAFQDGRIGISARVASMMYDNRMTIRQRIIHEAKAIKKDRRDTDGKLSIIPKAQMKLKLNGESPDVMDMIMMREIFDLKQTSSTSYAGRI